MRGKIFEILVNDLGFWKERGFGWEEERTISHEGVGKIRCERVVEWRERRVCSLHGRWKPDEWAIGVDG
jgi:hypothetical protein